MKIEKVAVIAFVTMTACAVLFVVAKVVSGEWIMHKSLAVSILIWFIFLLIIMGDIFTLPRIFMIGVVSVLISFPFAIIYILTFVPAVWTATNILGFIAILSGGVFGEISVYYITMVWYERIIRLWELYHERKWE